MREIERERERSKERRQGAKVLVSFKTSERRSEVG